MRRFFPVLLPLLAACSDITTISEKQITEVFTPYSIAVRQGNFVSQEMVAQLKPGLSKDQVRYTLGTPLVADPFHADRWDYVYRFRGSEEPMQQRHLIVFFEDGRLTRVGGDVTSNENAKAEDGPREAPREIEITPDPAGPKTEPDVKIPPREDADQPKKKR